MFQRFILAVQQGSLTAAGKTSATKAFGIFARDTKNGFITTIHHLLMILGVAAITALAIMFIKPDLAEKFKDLSPFAITEEVAEEDTAVAPPNLAMLMAPQQQAGQPEAVAAAVKKTAMSEEESRMLGTQRQQQWVTNWLAKRYRVASDATDMLVSAAYLTAKEIKLDPLLILSVMAIESGLNPFAESPVGAQGLMQVMSKVHHEKFQDLGGVKAALNPVANIKVGALILKDYVSRGGSVEAGLKLYVGAAAFDNDSGYGSRVLAEYRRLKDVATGKNVPTFVAPAAPRPQEPRKTEAVTDLKTTATELHNPDQVAKL
ncbi:transglycosylase SLT domain-containing protein [Undibacterium sp.]|uniref:transglycosylase SLT domain-containing protein n=1 Tax=Undibacterium sp. TaxID=1914977 RepID=UPI002C07E97F|nr:transglycosylase SLT domain-containing protein [Undibacterium sp.]HTD05129.1 transglycosylase SLT domain-containing protein [Undibacterium sp.]